jgi:hypothetical protein
MSLLDEEEWMKYSDIESEIIEDAFCGRNKTKVVELDYYRIDLHDSVQINKYGKNEQRQIRRVVINRNENEAAPERLFLSRSGAKTFSNSGLEGGIAFIYDWKKRNATLPDSEIVTQAANGIAVEGNQLDRQDDVQRITEKLIAMKNKSKEEILKCCIYLYSLSSFLFKLVNEVLRENNKTKMDTLAPFCYFLTEAIWSDALAQERYKSTVYRGIQLNLDSIHCYQEAIGTHKYWYGFTSTSRDREVAEIFGNTLFIIDISATGGLDILLYASNRDEEEVILSPGTTFRIDKVEHREDKTHIYLCVVPEVRMVLLGRTGAGNNADDLVLC